MGRHLCSRRLLFFCFTTTSGRRPDELTQLGFRFSNLKKSLPFLPFLPFLPHSCSRISAYLRDSENE